MSEYERGKHYKKKFIPQNKETGGRNYYGRRSPTANSALFTKETKSDISGNTKIKQPTILLKPREHSSEDSSLFSPRRNTKDNEVNTPTSIVTSWASATTTTTSESVQQPQQNVKIMKKSIKFLDDSILFSEKLQEFVQETTDFRVVAVFGGQGVGKSTILNIIAQNKVVEKSIFRHSNLIKQEEYGEEIDSQLYKPEDDKARFEVFKTQTGDDIENNTNKTHGIDVYITPNRVILLDCQPFSSIAVLDELIQSDNKRSNLVSEFIPHENSGEIQGLQLTAFLLSVCHVFIVVQDNFFDSNVVRFLQTAEMLKPTHSNPEDELNDYFPHLLLIQNKATIEDFSPKKFKIMQEVYKKLFSKSKLQKDDNLGLASTGLMTCLNQEVFGKPFNLFLIPEYNPNSNEIYCGHPPFNDLVRKLKINIFAATKNPLTHVQLTEKTWLTYCSKVWDNVRKSSFFVEYTKLMP